MFEGKIKDGCISKLTITENEHQATQYKKIIDILPVLCTNKNYRFIDDVLCTWTNVIEADFTPPYPDSDLWSNSYDVEIKTVDRLVVPLGNSKLPPIIRLEQKTHVFNANLQKQILSAFEHKSQIKFQE